MRDHDVINQHVTAIAIKLRLRSRPMRLLLSPRIVWRYRKAGLSWWHAVELTWWVIGFEGIALRETCEEIRVLGFCMWAWYSTLYRPTMRWMHRHDLHHAPILGPCEPGGGYQRWCHWCGMRQSYSYDPRLPIPGPIGKA